MTPMPMPSYPIRCYTSSCNQLACYKIAARWSDGVTGELKTYGVCCSECLEDWYKRARERRAACRLAPGETLEEPGIYQLEHGQRDQRLKRLPKLERDLSGA